MHMASKGNPNWTKGGPSPNPTGKAHADAAPPAHVNAMSGIAAMLTPHLDGYVNATTGLGLQGRDKTLATVFCPDIIDAPTAELIRRGDPIGARLAEMIPDEATSEPPELCIGDGEDPSENYYKPEKPDPVPQVMPGKPLKKGRTDGAARPLNSWERRVIAAVGRQRRRADAADAKSLTEDISHHLNSSAREGGLHALAKINEAIKYKNTCGGGAILIGANDYTTDMRVPLDLKRIRSLDYLTPLEARELLPLYFYNDPFSPRFGEPAIYQLVPYQIGAPIDPNIPPRVTQIHESRLIVFQGVRVSRRRLSGALPGWGDSIYTRVYRALKSYASSIQNIDILLSDFAQAVYKIKGLAAALLQNPNALTDAMMAVDLCRSIARAVIIDEGEEFKRESTSLAGYADMVDRLALNVAAASGLPMTRLFGTSAKGLNATGEGDDRMYFGSVSKVQTHEVAPAYLRLVEIELAIRGEDPANVTHSLAFKPLWQPSELETAQMRLAVAQADHIYITDQVYSPEEVAVSRVGGDTYSAETHLDFEARAEQMAVLPPPVDADPEPDPIPPAPGSAPPGEPPA